MNRLSRCVFILFVLLFSTLGFLHSALAAIPAIEREALIALYNSTNGDNWNNNSGWKDGPLDADGFAMPGTEHMWYGVTVTSDSVTSVSLSFNHPLQSPAFITLWVMTNHPYGC